LMLMACAIPMASTSEILIILLISRKSDVSIKSFFPYLIVSTQKNYPVKTILASCSWKKSGTAIFGSAGLRKSNLGNFPFESNKSLILILKLACSIFLVKLHSIFLSSCIVCFWLTYSWPWTCFFLR
jgi:hypothetical protein